MSAVDHSLHAHKQGDAKHSHSKKVSNQNLLLIALVLTLGFSGVEGAAAYFANSLALISDAGHMVTDAAALGLALLAQIISRRHHQNIPLDLEEQKLWQHLLIALRC